MSLVEAVDMREDAAALLVPIFFPGHSNFSDSSLACCGVIHLLFLNLQNNDVHEIIWQTKGWELEKLMVSQIML